MQAKLWSISALAVELGHDRRTIANWLEDLPPDEETPIAGERTSRKWRLARVVSHVYNAAESGSLDLNAERARLAKEQADKTAMANAVERGELLSVQTVQAGWQKIVGNIRGRFLGMPTKLSPQLAAAKQPRQCEDILRREIHSALTELANPGIYDEPSEASEGIN